MVSTNRSSGSSKSSSPRLILWIAAALALALLSACAAPGGQAVQSPIPVRAGDSAAESPIAVSTEAAIAPSPATGERGPAAALAPAERDGMYGAPPEMTIDTEAYYYATLRTEKGDIRIQLFADRAPAAVNNFVFLAREGYYDDTTFHRVIDGFMAQAGDPSATGAGGPGYLFDDEFFPGLEFDQAGLLAMANRGPGTNGSQFFITFAPTEWLNGGHTIFGKVIEGEDVLAEITRIDPESDAGMTGDKIFGVDIEESESSVLPTPTPPPPTPTPTATPTPYAPSALNPEKRPLATVEPVARVNYFNTPPEMVIDASNEYEAVIETSQGVLVVQLFADTAPVSVNNFVTLANLGFYDNTPISLVRPGDSIVFGLPDDNPLNDAGYKIPADVNPDAELNLGVLTYIPVEYASGDTVLSSSSQILVALVEPPSHLAAELGFFGQIVEGLDLLPNLTTDDTIRSITINAPD